MQIPTGQWVKVDMRCTVGAASTGKWDLSVTLPDGAKREFAALPCASGPLRNLTWLGFSSMATVKTAFQLDDLVLTSTGKARK
jgi:hypothetical protein